MMELDRINGCATVAEAEELRKGYQGSVVNFMQNLRKLVMKRLYISMLHVEYRLIRINLNSFQHNISLKGSLTWEASVLRRFEMYCVRLDKKSDGMRMRRIG